MRYIKELLSILPVRYVHGLIAIIGLMTLTAILQTSGLGAVLPVVSVLVDPEMLQAQEYWKYIEYVFDTNDISSLTVMLLGAYAVIYIVMLLLLVIVDYCKMKYVCNLEYHLSCRMLHGYIESDYSFFLKRNSSILLKNIISEVHLFTRGLLVAGFQLVAYLFMLSGVAIFFCILNPSIFLASSGGLLLFALLFKGTFKRITGRWSKERDEHMSNMSRTAHHVLSGIKEIRIARKEDYFTGRFSSTAIKYCRLTFLYNFVTGSTGTILNLIVFGALLAVLWLAVLNGLNVKNYIPMLALIAVAVNRVVPMVAGVSQSLISVRYYWKSLDNVKEALDGGGSMHRNVRPPSQEEVGCVFMESDFSLEGVDYGYTGVECLALQGIDLTIARNSRVAFVGSSGAGKSTAINVLLGLLRPTAGTVKIDGKPLDESNLALWWNQLGYVPQQVYLFDASLRENIAFGVDEADVCQDRLDRAIKLSRLDQLIENLPDGLETKVGERGVRLSGGEQQRIGIARALYSQPRILILDEPTSALDPVNEKNIINDVLEIEDITIVVVTHRLSSVRFCDKLVYFENGRIACEGSHDELLRDCPAFAEMNA